MASTQKRHRPPQSDAFENIWFRRTLYIVFCKETKSFPISLRSFTVSHL